VNLRTASLPALVGILAVLTSATPARAATYGPGVDYFSFQDDQVVESSGVVASSVRDGVFFTHNDSGDVASFFAVDDQGCTLARYALTGLATPEAEFKASHDVEDIARGPLGGVSTLWLADIGDNLHQRSEIAVYAVAEPKSDASTHRESGGCPTPAEEVVPATTYRLQYPDVAHDAETLLADPATGQLFIVTKAPTGESQVYAAPETLDASAVNILSFVTEIVFPPSTTYDREPEEIVAGGAEQLGFDATGRLWAVGGDIAPVGDRVVIRTYTDAFEWTIGLDHDLRTALAGTPTRVALKYERQGEAIAYTRDGGSLVTTCEDVGCTAHRYEGS
jgi:hypothetical protein